MPDMHQIAQEHKTGSTLNCVRTLKGMLIIFVLNVVLKLVVTIGLLQWCTMAELWANLQFMVPRVIGCG